MNGKIYLIPNTLGDVPPLETMPLSVKKLLKKLTYTLLKTKSLQGDL